MHKLRSAGVEARSAFPDEGEDRDTKLSVATGNFTGMSANMVLVAAEGRLWG